MDKITLKAARVNAGYTQEEVAEIGGVNRNTVGSWERGTAVPDHLQLLGLASLYQVSVDAILLPETQG